MQHRARQLRRLLQLQRRTDLSAHRGGRTVNGRRLATFALAVGALACTKPANPNPGLPSGTGGSGVIITGTAGSIVPPPPSGMVIVEIQEPMPGLVALAGSLVDIRVNARVDQGDDVIDTTSVEATVTA